MSDSRNDSLASAAIEEDDIHGGDSDAKLSKLLELASLDNSGDERAPVPSLVNDGTGQSDPFELAPEIPFPAFSDPFEYEITRIEEKRSFLKDEFERQKGNQRESSEAVAVYNARLTGLEEDMKRLILHKQLASAFLSKAATNTASPGIPELVSVLNQASSLAPLHLDSVLCPMPQPIQPLFSNTDPSVTASLNSPLPDLNQ